MSTSLGHESVGINQPLNLNRRPELHPIRDVEFAILPHRLVSRLQMGRRLLTLKPPGRIEVNALAHTHLFETAGGRQRGGELEQGGFELVADP